MTQPAPADIAPAAPAQPEEAAPAPAEAPVTIDTSRGYDSESYTWPDEEPGAGEQTPAAVAAEPPAQPETTTPETPASPAPGGAPAAAPTSQRRLAEMTPEEKRAMFEDPEIRAEIDRRAQGRAGNLLQQQQEQDRKFRDAESFYQENFASKPAEEKERLRADPNFGQWVRQFETLRDERAAATTKAPAADVEAVRQTVRQEELQTWNVSAAREFGARVSKLPFIANLPAAKRQALAEGSQQSTDQTWLDEYVSYIEEGYAAALKTAVAEAVEAAKNDMRAEGAPAGGPVVAPSRVAPGALTPQEVLERHMEHGMRDDFNPEGVTPEQLAQAKRALGREY